MTLYQLIHARYIVGALSLALAAAAAFMTRIGAWPTSLGVGAVGLALMAALFAFPWSKVERGLGRSSSASGR